MGRMLNSGNPVSKEQRGEVTNGYEREKQKKGDGEREVPSHIALEIVGTHEERWDRYIRQ
jgi:hypothetical protein